MFVFRFRRLILCAVGVLNDHAYKFKGVMCALVYDCVRVYRSAVHDRPCVFGMVVLCCMRGLGRTGQN